MIMSERSDRAEKPPSHIQAEAIGKLWDATVLWGFNGGLAFTMAWFEAEAKEKSRDPL